MIVAAYLKLSQAVTLGINETKLIFVLKTLILFGEFLLGTWLVFQNSNLRLKSWIVFFVFFAFGVYQFRQLQLGRSSCSCFGRFEFSPLLVGIVDIAIASIAICLMSNRLELGGNEVSTNSIGKIKISMRNWLISICVVIWTGFTWLELSAMRVPISISSINSLINNKVPILKPIIRIDESIVGDEFNLKSVIGTDVPVATLSGKWSVAFVRSGCPACSELILRLKKMRVDSAYEGRVILISLTPFPSSKQTANSNHFEFTANQNYTWVVSTPLCLEVSDAKVLSVLDCSDIF